MRNDRLHTVLRAYAEQASAQLAADAQGGAEVPFELVDSGSARTPLYCYRPLTADFIRSRLGVLGRLPAYGPAARVLEGLDGVDAYLRRRGERRVPVSAPERADAALRVFLEAALEDASDFVLSPERLERAYLELEVSVHANRSVFTVVAPLLGLELESAEVALGDGLSLLHVDALVDPPAELVRARPVVLVALHGERAPDDPPPAPLARVRFRRLLDALRLYESGGFALRSTGWGRVDGGSWSPVALAGGGAPHGLPVLVGAAQEDELRAFCSLISRRTPSAGPLAWALARHGMGRERLVPFEALTDHLLAARALLEPEGPTSGRLARRLAALCALPEQRDALAERVAHAISLERATVAGLVPAQPGADALVDELAHHLRCLLRDVLCGHLDPDLCALADALAERDTLEREALVVG